MGNRTGRSSTARMDAQPRPPFRERHRRHLQRAPAWMTESAMHTASGAAPSRRSRALSLARISTLPLVLLMVFLALRRSPRDPPRSEALLSALRDLSSAHSVIAEKVVYSNYARVYSRTIRYADGRNFTFDVWGRNWRDGSFGVAIAVPFSRRGRRAGSFTLVREYCVAHARFVYAFPAGQVEKKHVDARAAAAAELAEEARLRCATPLVPLLETPDGAPQDKFQRESVHYFLCSDARPDKHAAQRDAEERIQIVRDVKPADLLRIIRAGAMQSNNIAAAMLALAELRNRRLL